MSGSSTSSTFERSISTVSRVSVDLYDVPKKSKGNIGTGNNVYIQAAEASRVIEGLPTATPSDPEGQKELQQEKITRCLKKYFGIIDWSVALIMIIFVLAINAPFVYAIGTKNNALAPGVIGSELETYYYSLTEKLLTLQIPEDQRTDDQVANLGNSSGIDVLREFADLQAKGQNLLNYAHDIWILVCVCTIVNTSLIAVVLGILICQRRHPIFKTRTKFFLPQLMVSTFMTIGGIFAANAVGLLQVTLDPDKVKMLTVVFSFFHAFGTQLAIYTIINQVRLLSHANQVRVIESHPWYKDIKFVFFFVFTTCICYVTIVLAVYEVSFFNIYITHITSLLMSGVMCPIVIGWYVFNTSNITTQCYANYYCNVRIVFLLPILSAIVLFPQLIFDVNTVYSLVGSAILIEVVLLIYVLDYLAPFIFYLIYVTKFLT